MSSIKNISHVFRWRSKTCMGRLTAPGDCRGRGRQEPRWTLVSHPPRFLFARILRLATRRNEMKSTVSAAGEQSLDVVGQGKCGGTGYGGPSHIGFLYHARHDLSGHRRLDLVRFASPI